MIKIDDIAISVLNKMIEEKKNTTNEWLAENSKYKLYKSLEIDKRGSFGERLFGSCLYQLFPRRFEYKDGDQGDWDLKVEGLKFEVKTSSFDSNKRFQNQGIKQDGDYDGILFLGVKPNQLFIKFIAKSKIDFSNLHDRGLAKTGAGFKWDFKENDMIEINTLEDIRKEFEIHFTKKKRS